MCRDVLEISADDNDMCRVQLWADLCKVARQQKIWDVCRVTAHFCLLYDDARWQLGASPSSESLLVTLSYNRNWVWQFATCLIAAGTHVTCGITQCYLPLSRGDIPAGYLI